MRKSKTLLAPNDKGGSVSVRKIANGWIVSKTREKKGKGGMIDFEMEEMYYAAKPKIEVK